MTDMNTIKPLTLAGFYEALSNLYTNRNSNRVAGLAWQVVRGLEDYHDNEIEQAIPDDVTPLLPQAIEDVTEWLEWDEVESILRAEGAEVLSYEALNRMIFDCIWESSRTWVDDLLELMESSVWDELHEVCDPYKVE